MKITEVSFITYETVLEEETETEENILWQSLYLNSSQYRK